MSEEKKYKSVEAIVARLRGLPIPTQEIEDMLASFVRDEVNALLHSATGMMEKETREELAELEHEQWIAWSKNIAETEVISPGRLARWKLLWCPYSELSESQKDQDREWADKVISIIRKIRDDLTSPKEE